MFKDDLKNDKIPWIIKTETSDGEKETNTFDYVIVATGFYSKPYTPIFKGQNKFSGSIVSPSAIKSHKQLQNKRVIVIGCGKCATDMAVLAGRYAQSCYLVFRKAYWMTSIKIIEWFITIKTVNDSSIFYSVHTNSWCIIWWFISFSL